MKWLFELYSRLLKQQPSGAVEIDERAAPGVQDLAGLLNKRAFLIRQPAIQFDGPLSLLVLTGDIVHKRTVGEAQFLFALKRRLEHSGRNVHVRRMGRRSGMEVDGEFYPFLLLIKTRQALQSQASAHLRTATTKGQGSLSARFLRKLPLHLSVKGTFWDTGYATKAEFWSERGSPCYRVSVKMPYTTDIALLHEVDHDPLRDLWYGRPILILSSHDSPAAHNVMALSRGVHFYSDFQFGQNLQAATVSPTPQVLAGDFRLVGPARTPLFRLQSSPFNLEFEGVKFRYANLTITGQYDEEYDYRPYMAQLRAIWDAGPLQLPMQTYLPRDTQVLSWNTLAMPSFDEDGKLLVLDRPVEGQYVTTLSSLNQLIPITGGSGNWFTAETRLAHMLGKAQPSHLLAAHVDVNLLARRPASVRVELWAPRLTDEHFQDRLFFSPVVFTISMIHPFGGGERALLANIYATLWLGGVAFDGHFRPPQMTFRGVARQANIEALCRFFQIGIPQQLQFLGVRMLTVELNVFDRILSVRVKTMNMAASEVVLV